MTTGMEGAGSSSGFLGGLMKLFTGVGDNIKKDPNLWANLLALGGKATAGNDPMLNTLADGAQSMQRMYAYQGVMKKLLEGMPEGGKFSYSPESGVKINLPDLGSMLAGEDDPLDINTSMADLGVDTSKAIKPLSTEGAGTPTVNPSRSQQGQGLGLSDFSLNDLAGMTPEDFNSAMDMAAKFKELTTPKSSDRFPVPIPGIGYVTPEIWKTMPDKEKNYALYASMAKANGGEFMDRREFNSMEPTGQELTIRAMMDDPELFKMWQKMEGIKTHSQAKSIARMILEMKAGSDMKSYEEISSPDYIRSIDKKLGENFLTNISRYMNDPTARGVDALKAYKSELESTGWDVEPLKKDISVNDKVIELKVINKETGISKTVKFPFEHFIYKEE